MSVEVHFGEMLAEPATLAVAAMAEPVLSQCWCLIYMAESLAGSPPWSIFPGRLDRRYRELWQAYIACAGQLFWLAVPERL